MALKWLGDTSGNDNKDRLIASYKVNGVSFDSSQIVVNTTSNTFTITNHGLVNGDQVSLGVTGGINEVPKCGQQSGMRLYVISATTDTFQLSSTSGGAALTFTTAGSVAQNAWKLFKNTGITTINFSGINTDKVRIMARGNICIGSGASRGGFSSPFLPNDVEFAQDCFYVDAVYGIYENNDKYSHEIRGFSARYYMLPQGGVNTGNSNVINRVVPVFTPIGGRIGEVSIGLYGTGFYCAGTVMEVYGIE